MSIYTKTGDSGTTSLFGGKRVSKADLQVEAYGNLDELNSFLGLLEAKLLDKKEKQSITSIQKDLYKIMSYLSGYPKFDKKTLSERVIFFEKTMDFLAKKLPALNSFIIPQGGEVTALLHITRTVCRRSERAVLRSLERKKMTDDDKTILVYLNRLSDFLFMLGRYYSYEEKIIGNFKLKKP